MDPREGEFGGERGEELPARLFALDHYPTETKINAYSKPEHLAVIAEALKGTEEMKFLLRSPFRKLFEIPPNKSSFSGKLILGLICRQLVTKKRHEMWMVFGGQPFKFGLREFSLITGLECGQFPKKEDLDEVLQVKPGCKKVWETLFTDNPKPTVMDLVDKLRRGDQMDDWKKLALSLIIIVDGVLRCSTQPVTPYAETVEMTKDIDYFCKYPWGRMSFTHTLEMITGFKEAGDVESLVTSCKKKSFAIHGFPLALQLLAFETFPSLARLVPDEETVNNFTQRSIHNLAKLRPIRSSGILACEDADEVEVNRIIEPEDPVMSQSLQWTDEVEDAQVDYIENQIEAGHRWEEKAWVGGDDECDKQLRPAEKAGVTKKRKGKAQSKVEKKKQKTTGGKHKAAEEEINVDDDRFEVFAVELERCFRKQNAMIDENIKELKEGLKDFVRGEVSNALAGKGKAKVAPQPAETSEPSKTPSRNTAKKAKVAAETSEPSKTPSKNTAKKAKVAAETSQPSKTPLKKTANKEKVVREPSKSLANKTAKKAEVDGEPSEPAKSPAKKAAQKGKSKPPVVEIGRRRSSRVRNNLASKHSTVEALPQSVQNEPSNADGKEVMEGEDPPTTNQAMGGEDMGGNVYNEEPAVEVNVGVEDKEVDESTLPQASQANEDEDDGDNEEPNVEVDVGVEDKEVDKATLPQSSPHGNEHKDTAENGQTESGFEEDIFYDARNDNAGDGKTVDEDVRDEHRVGESPTASLQKAWVLHSLANPVDNVNEDVNKAVDDDTTDVQPKKTAKAVKRRVVFEGR